MAPKGADDARRRDRGVCAALFQTQTHELHGPAPLTLKGAPTDLSNLGNGAFAGGLFSKGGGLDCVPFRVRDSDRIAPETFLWASERILCFATPAANRTLASSDPRCFSTALESEPGRRRRRSRGSNRSEPAEASAKRFRRTAVRRPNTRFQRPGRTLKDPLKGCRNSSNMVAQKLTDVAARFGRRPSGFEKAKTKGPLKRPFFEISHVGMPHKKTGPRSRAVQAFFSAKSSRRGCECGAAELVPDRPHRNRVHGVRPVRAQPRQHVG
ncbi:hypothetical protein M885DRAFT_289870 [Pelagophyceae sp. CCMP2097]|nr:hypothetical protein M885DRAFT_289870 [Pelagophyceae sp. CCMP2097]